MAADAGQVICCEYTVTLVTGFVPVLMGLDFVAPSLKEVAWWVSAGYLFESLRRRFTPIRLKLPVDEVWGGEEVNNVKKVVKSNSTTKKIYLILG